MIKRRIDSEIKQKNYEKELLLCQKAGGDVEEYRRLSFDVLQLEQIRKGLENKIDVSRYLDPTKSWLEMEEIRVSMETGFHMDTYLEQGFDWMQCNEIRAGMESGVDISKYLDTDFMSSQMKEIRKGLERGVDVSFYAKNEYDWFQMREIRRGLEEKVDVTKFAKAEYNHSTMRALRLALMDEINLLPLVEKGYSGKILTEIHRGLVLGNDVSTYLEQGYNAEQLKQINNAHELGVNLLPHLRIEFHGVQLQEIIQGLQAKIDVFKYAKMEYNWFQMREIRYGLEKGLDVTPYLNPDFTYRQMEIIRKGIESGLDVSEYAKVYYEPEEMEEIRRKREKEGAVLSHEMEELFRNSLMREGQAEGEASGGKDDESDDFVLDSCVTVSDDSMKVFIDFSSVRDMMPERLMNMKVSDVMRILNHFDVKQGVLRGKIKEMLDKKMFDRSVLVAEGKPAVDGEDGRFTYYFRKQIQRKPKVREDGSVDYKSMELFEAVKKDSLVAEYRPATLGMFGYDVTGQLISPKRGKEQVPLRGEGFMITEDQKKYYSLLDGIIELNEEQGKMSIRNLYVVNGNVDASTGNVSFDGDINILGSVEAGFMVSATGNIVIDGHCDGCRISAGKDVIIRKGCQGQNVGEIIAGGQIVGQFFESAKLFAKGDIQASYLLNCQLKTEGHLLVEGRKGVIIGGYTCAKQGVTCYGLGNIAEIKTILEVGIDKEDMAAYQELEKKLDKVEAEMKTCESALNKFMEDTERSEKIVALVERLTKAIYTQKQQRKQYLEEKEVQMEKLVAQKAARVIVTGTVFTGTLIYMNSEPYVVRENMNNVEFIKQEAQINPYVR